MCSAVEDATKFNDIKARAMLHWEAFVLPLLHWNTKTYYVF